MADPYDYDSDTSLQALLQQLYNPYASDIMLAYGYQPSTGTPSITNPGTYVDPDPSGTVPLPPPGVYTPPDPLPPFDPGVDPTPDPPPDPPSNPCPAGYIMGPRGVCILDPTVQPPGDPDPPGEPPPPSGPPTGYVSPASLEGYDPFIHSRRHRMSGTNVLAGSRQEVDADEFNRLLGNMEGRYGEGAFYDPERGSIYHNYDRVNTMEYPPKNTSYVPIGIDPRNYSDTEALQAAHLGLGHQLDERGRAMRSRNPIYTNERIGNKMYFVDDGKVYSYDVQDVEYDSTPSFARGGAVSPIASHGIGALFAKGNM
jgi:hypothetical protein